MPGPALPVAVEAELRRIALRWAQLAFASAADRMPLVHSVVEALAGEPVPDLGPAVVIDQLRVVAYDACVAGAHEADIATRLVALRRSLV